jgi:glyoxylase-like metal-dependent hydrolase (beta-lactamase superfamily II)
MNARTQSFFDQGTSTFSYVVFDPISQFCIVIDPVLNYDPKSGRTNTSSTDIVISFIKENHLKLDWILETHAHADHLSAAAYLRDELGGKVAIGEEIVRVQNVFKGIFNLGDEFKVDGSQFDYLLKDQETITFGNLSFKSLFVPGHTPACMAYEIEDSIFVGDTMFMPDVGTARCDFPGGEAATLYHSIKKILSYPADTKLYMCHDYPPPTRSAQFLTSVKDQRTSNIHVNDSVGLNDFISMRTKRDKELEMPVLILPAIQINIRAGKMPPKETNGTSYLKIPMNLV